MILTKTNTMSAQDKIITPKFRSRYIHNICFLATFLFAYSFLATNSQAQSALDQQDWIARNQQNILEEEKRTREFNTIKKERERKKKEESEEESQKQKLKVSGKPSECFEVKEVDLDGANLISSRAQKNLIAPFLGRCFEATILSDLVTAVNGYYQNKGYVTAQVSVPKQNVQSGVLKLQITEGKIEKISLGKDRFIEKMQELTAFGNIEGGDLNVHDINQGLYQINRLSSNAAVMKISPGSADGESLVTIDNNKKFPARVTVGEDNLGNEFTGVRRNSFSGSFDNLLFLNDNINLNYTTNLKDSAALKDIKSFSGGISIPLSYNTISFDYYKSEFLGTIAGQNGNIKSAGFSSQKKVTIDRVLASRTNFRLSANSSVAQKDTESRQSSSKTDVSQRRLVVGNLGLALSYYLSDSSSIYLKPSYSRGLKILNAKQDLKNVSASTPKAQFEVFKLYASASKRLTIPKLNAPVTFTTEMDSQFGKSNLFGSEQFSVGGYYSVRGFREDYITGDSGYNFRNKFNVNLGSILAPLFAKKSGEKPTENFLTKNLRYLNKFNLEPFYDYGHARLKYNGDSGRMAGAGVKTIFNSKYFSASLTYSQALQKSKLITSPIKENKLIYFEVSASCC